MSALLLWNSGVAGLGAARSSSRRSNPDTVKRFFLVLMADAFVWGPPSPLRAYSLGVKQTGSDTTSPSSCAESENAWSCTSFSPRFGITSVITRKQKGKPLCIWKIANAGPDCGPCGGPLKFVQQNKKK